MRPSLYNLLTGLVLFALPAASHGIQGAAPGLRSPESRRDAAQTASGVYDIYFGGVLKGTSRYRFEGPDRLVLEGVSIQGAPSKGLLIYRASRPISVHFETAGGSTLSIDYTAGTAGMIRQDAQGETKIPLPSGGGFYYTQHPILLKPLLGRYVVSKGGFQDLPALDLLSGKPRPLSAERERVETRRVDGKTTQVVLWRLETPPNAEALLYTDANNRPLAWWVPALHFEMVERGAEALRPSARYARSLSQATYKVKEEQGVWVPMRDGVRLMADVYRPDAEGRFPVLLQRTPYERDEFGRLDGAFYAQRGYVYVTQHVRGRGGSEGEFRVCLGEDRDGYDSVQWCAAQPWSSGKVGMLGASYNGFCAWMAAKTHPPALKAMIALVPMPGSPAGAPWSGGPSYFGDFLNWFGLLRDRTTVQPFNLDATQALNTLPILNSDNVLFGKDVPAYDFWTGKDRQDEEVRQGTYRFDMDKIDLPVLHISGWFDTVGIGTKLNYLQMKAAGRKNQKLVWGPWDHLADRSSKYEELDFGPDAYIDLHTLMLRWFDRWLKGKRNGVDREPPVDAFLIGENRWLHDTMWPSPRMVEQKWFLHAPAGGRWAVSAERSAPQNGRGAPLERSVGDEHGGLSLTTPTQEAPGRYTYDPAAYRAGADLQANYLFSKGDDVRSLCAREGQILYDTEPLNAPLRLCGPVRGRLWAASSAVDTDWVMALIDVAPDGKAIALCAGIVRARFRDSYEHPTLLEPGKPYFYDLDLWQTGVKIPKGHRLRVAVASTLFPDMDRNLNAGDPSGSATRIVIARQTIYQDDAHLSYIVLPVLPGAARG